MACILWKSPPHFPINTAWQFIYQWQSDWSQVSLSGQLHEIREDQPLYGAAMNLNMLVPASCRNVGLSFKGGKELSFKGGKAQVWRLTWPSHTWLTILPASQLRRLGQEVGREKVDIPQWSCQPPSSGGGIPAFMGYLQLASRLVWKNLPGLHVVRRGW